MACCSLVMSEPHVMRSHQSGAIVVLLSIAGRNITQALDVEEALLPKKEKKVSGEKRKRVEEISIAFLRDGKEALFGIAMLSAVAVFYLPSREQAAVTVVPSILGSEDRLRML
ncbi:unnamed protein product [Symbiodinium natans]|uniref:Uncharacterized protein n=1 Tax=Symbiodinium natans TaxID=878477 RepID=A0A812RGP2_9DINO|nr:unnamed protein product [Symbiodinium natans]